MSKAPKHSSQRQDLKRWDNEGGAPRSGPPSYEPPFVPERREEAALYYFNLRTPSGVIEDPEGDTYASVQAARDAALAKARDMITEGDQKSEDRRSWHVEIMNRANQPVMTVMFSEAFDSKPSG